MVDSNRVGRVSINGQMVDPNTLTGARLVRDLVSTGQLSGPENRELVTRITQALDLQTHGGSVATALYGKGLLPRNPKAMDIYVDKIDPNTREGRERIGGLERDRHLRSNPSYIETLRGKADPSNKHGADSLSILNKVPVADRGEQVR